MKRLITSTLLTALMFPTISLALTNGTSSSSSPEGTYCPRLASTLQRGSRDATTKGQVTELQIFLTAHFGLLDVQLVGGSYGSLTRKYVIKFQTEQGLTASGIVGALTRAKIAQICNKTTSLGADALLRNKQQQAQRALAAFEPALLKEFAKLVQRIRTSTRTDIPNARAFADKWGDKILNKFQTLSDLSVTSVGSMTVTQLDSFLSQMFELQQMKMALLSAYNALPVNELNLLPANETWDASTTPQTTGQPSGATRGSASITVLSPNGGEQVTMNYPFDIKWKAANIKWVEIALFRNEAQNQWIMRNIPDDGTGTYTWDPTITAFAAGGGYKILINAQTNDGSYVQDMSDAPFTFFFSDTLPTLNEQCATFTFTKDAKQGDVGGEIVQLRSFLGLGRGNTFTPDMLNYVKAFQKKYASEILTPQGLSAPNGIWGAFERAKANAIDSKCTTPPQPTNMSMKNSDLKVNGSDGPIVLTEKQPVTVTWISTGSTGCNLHGVYETASSTHAYITDLPTSGTRQVFAYVPSPLYAGYEILLSCSQIPGSSPYSNDDAVPVTNGTSASAKGESLNPNLANALTALQSALSSLLATLSPR